MLPVHWLTITAIRSLKLRFVALVAVMLSVCCHNSLQSQDEHVMASWTAVHVAFAGASAPHFWCVRPESPRREWRVRLRGGRARKSDRSRPGGWRHSRVGRGAAAAGGGPSRRCRLGLGCAVTACGAVAARFAGTCLARLRAVAEHRNRRRCDARLLDLPGCRRAPSFALSGAARRSAKSGRLADVMQCFPRGFLFLPLALMACGSSHSSAPPR